MTVHLFFFFEARTCWGGNSRQKYTFEGISENLVDMFDRVHLCDSCKRVERISVCMLTLQDPPPRFSFHHRVFSKCNFPSSCSFSMAPLMAVLYGESEVPRSFWATPNLFLSRVWKLFAKFPSKSCRSSYPRETVRFRSIEFYWIFLQQRNFLEFLRFFLHLRLTNPMKFANKTYQIDFQDRN